MYGKMQESGLSEVVPCTRSSAIWDQYPVFHTWSSSGLTVGSGRSWRLLDGRYSSPSWELWSSHQEGQNSWWLWHPCLPMWQETLHFSFPFIRAKVWLIKINPHFVGAIASMEQRAEGIPGIAGPTASCQTSWTCPAVLLGHELCPQCGSQVLSPTWFCMKHLFWLQLFLHIASPDSDSGFFWFICSFHEMKISPAISINKECHSQQWFLASRCQRGLPKLRSSRCCHSTGWLPRSWGNARSKVNKETGLAPDS